MRGRPARSGDRGDGSRLFTAAPDPDRDRERRAGGNRDEPGNRQSDGPPDHRIAPARGPGHTGRRSVLRGSRYWFWRGETASRRTCEHEFPDGITPGESYEFEIICSAPGNDLSFVFRAGRRARQDVSLRRLRTETDPLTSRTGAVGPIDGQVRASASAVRARPGTEIGSEAVKFQIGESTVESSVGTAGPGPTR